MTPYRGRFAPSPTGRLHFGSLVSAVASYARARSQQGIWLVRIEDIDQPREVPGAARLILSDLASFGMESDEPVIYQSRRLELYDNALESLAQAGRSYRCGCTRKELAGARIYPGTCSKGLPPGKSGRSVRFRCQDARTVWDDIVQGPQAENVLR